MTTDGAHRYEVDPRSSAGRWAVGLAAAALVLVVAAGALYAVTVAVAGTDATEDNVVGLLVATGVLAGLTLSLAGLVVAGVTRARHEAWPLMWLPFTVFPALAVLLVLGEALWWE